ncbi:hypothetical protein MPSEU_000020100 [Mayamaea pseudoterrestris]|nr:hypothetical protein MPSEU_000020100 [Mayamaea pseudoterrestris]
MTRIRTHAAISMFFVMAAQYCQTALAQEWKQLGKNIDGIYVEEWFGGKVSLSKDGKSLAASAVFSDNYRGRIRVYDYIKSSKNWVQRGFPIRGDYQGDNFGQSVVLSGNGMRLAIGSPFSYSSDSVYLARGDVKVYDWDLISKSWKQMGTDIYAEASRDRAGASVALSTDGSVLAIGAPYNDGASGKTTENAGQVRVFDWSSSTNMWIQRGTDIDGENYYDFSGTSVALSGDGTVVAIGAPYNDGTSIDKDVSTDTRTNWRGFDGGQVRVYRWISSRWSKLGNDIDGTTVNGGFGETIALSEDATMLAVAAPGWGTDVGVVKIMSWNGVNWIQKGQSIVRPSDQGFYDFPVAMSSDGSHVAVGMPAEPATNATGSVTVYKFTGSAWEQDGETIIGDAVSEYAGSSVSLSGDGSVVAFGAPEHDGFANKTGSVRVFASPRATSSPSNQPSTTPSTRPTRRPTRPPVTKPPTRRPTRPPVTKAPTRNPTRRPSLKPTRTPTGRPTRKPTRFPTKLPTLWPTRSPTRRPTKRPSRKPTRIPTGRPTKQPTKTPTKLPTGRPTRLPTKIPTKLPTRWPTRSPTKVPTRVPTRRPSFKPTRVPTKSPTTRRPATRFPTRPPTKPPTTRRPATRFPTRPPTNPPTTRRPATRFPTRPPTKPPTTRRPATRFPTRPPSKRPTMKPSRQPSAPNLPTQRPTSALISDFTQKPTRKPSRLQPTTEAPTRRPTMRPRPTVGPTSIPTSALQRPFAERKTDELVEACMNEIFVKSNCECSESQRICIKSTIQVNCYKFKSNIKKRKFRRQLNQRIRQGCELQAHGGNLRRFVRRPE